MNKQKILKILNILLLLSFIIQTLNAILIDYIGREIFHKIHPINGFIMIFLAIIHIILNWGWIKNSYLKMKKK